MRGPKHRRSRRTEQFCRVRCRLFPFAWLCAFACAAQQPWTIGVRGGYGFMAPHHYSLWYLVEEHALTGEAFVEHAFSGRREWHHAYGGPRWGLGFLITDAGSPTYIGTAMRLLPYLDLPLHRGERLSINARIGWGLGHVARPFHRLEHYKQNAIGSHLNGGVVLALEARRAFGRATVAAGLSLDHWSNAAFKIPNLGINVATANLSVRYRIGGERPMMPAMDTASWKQVRTSAFIAFSWGSQQVYPVGSGRFNVFSLNATLHRRLTIKSSVGGGVDLFNKESLAVLDPELQGGSRAALTQMGLHAGYALWFGRLSVPIDVGIYLITPYDEKSVLYQRIGMRQRIGSRWTAALMLKTHFGTADHFELGLCYQLR